MPFDVTDTVLIVVGSELVPEEKDRPLAYRLKNEMDEKGDHRFQKALVTSDLWYLDNPIFQACPTVFLGGPGVNKATIGNYDRIPLVWTAAKRTFVHFTLSDGEVKAAIWGMNEQGTAEALNAFLAEGYMEKFTNRIWNRPI